MWGASKCRLAAIREPLTFVLAGGRANDDTMLHPLANLVEHGSFEAMVSA